MPPTTASECYDSARKITGAGTDSQDVSSGWTMTYSEESRPLGASGTLYLCIPEEEELTVSVAPHPGLAVDSNPLAVRASSGRVEELLVTVTAGDDEEHLAVKFDLAGDSSATLVITVDVDGDEWSFGRRVSGG